MDAQTIKNLISRNQWETVFTTLKKIEANDENWDNQVVQLESRYRYLKLQKAQGVLTTEEVNIELNRLREAILELVKDLQSQPPDSFFSQQNIIIMSIVLAVIIALLYFTQCPSGNSINPIRNEKPQEKHVLEGAIQSNGEDVEGVEVRIDDANLSAFTNAKGRFKIEIPPNNHHEAYLIRLIKQGYETLTETYEMSNSQKPIYNLQKIK
jgi:hypothetical protein